MKRAATAPGPALSAIPAMSAMVPAHLTGDGITSYTLTDTEVLPSPAGSGRNMTEMAGIADAERPATPKVVRERRSKTGGRQKGTPNRVTADIRAALRDLAERNADRVQEWLDRVAEDDPAEAIRLYLSLCRYVVPVLSAAAIADVTPKRPIDALSKMTDEELLAHIIDTPEAVMLVTQGSVRSKDDLILHFAMRDPPLALPAPDPDDEELIR